MDFHSLTRKELQFLCKLNKIPANMTNVAMADALQSAEIVEGIEKFINDTQPKKADLDESKENVEELSSPKVPNTKCRTTSRKQVKTTELELLKPTATRTTRRTAKKIAGEVEESKNDAMETPALSSTRRKAMATSSCRNVNSQLNDCELEAKEDQKSSAAVATKSRRKVATTSTTLKKESTVQKAYSTRRSNSMLDEMNVASDEVSTVEVPDSTVTAEVEDICNAFDELVVVVEDVFVSEEKEDSGEVDHSQKQESDENSNLHDEGVLEEELNDAESEPNDTSNSCEIGGLEEEKHESEVVAFEKHTDIILDENSNSESDIAAGDVVEVDAISSNTESLNATPELGQEGKCSDVSEMNTESPNEFLSSDFTPADENTNEVLVDDTLDVTPAIDNLIEEASDDMAVAVSSEISDDFEGSSINNEKEEITLQEASTQLTEEKSSDSRVRKEIEAGVKIDSLLDEVVENIMEAGASVLKTDTFESNREQHSESFLDDNDEIESGEDENSTKSEGMNLEKTAIPCDIFTPVHDEKTENDITEGSEFVGMFVNSNAFVTVGDESEDADQSSVLPLEKKSVVSDDKENIGNKGKKENEDENGVKLSLEDKSLRQLRKQFKELKLKSINQDGRPALQPLCENQMVGGEAKI